MVLMAASALEPKYFVFFEDYVPARCL